LDVAFACTWGVHVLAMRHGPYQSRATVKCRCANELSFATLVNVFVSGIL
jgi:hypothetical protein